MCAGMLALCSELTFDLIPVVQIQAFPLSNCDLDEASFLTSLGFIFFIYKIEIQQCIPPRSVVTIKQNNVCKVLNTCLAHCKL